MNRRTFMQKTGLIMSGLTLSPLIGKSYSSIYGQTAPSNKVKVALIGCRSAGEVRKFAFASAAQQ